MTFDHQYAILGNPSYPIPCQLYELFRIALEQDELNWEHFNALRKVVNGIVTLANISDPTVFPGLPDDNPVLVQRLFHKLLNELHHLKDSCPEGQYKTLLEGALEKYAPTTKQPAVKRPKPQKETDLLSIFDQNDFKTLVPYQSVKFTGSALKGKKAGLDPGIQEEYLKSKEVPSKAFWEYLF